MSLSSALRTATLELLRQIKEREETDPPMTIISKAEGEGKNVKDSSDPPANDQVLSLFMRLAGEPITWIEAKELWNGMRSTNAGELPMLKDTIMHASWRSLHSLVAQDDSEDTPPTSDGDVPQCFDDPSLAEPLPWVFTRDIETIKNFNDVVLEKYAMALARGIKEQYSIRLSDDTSEFWFVLCSLAMLWTAAIVVLIAGLFYPENAKLGTFTPNLFVEAFSLFGIELAWECFLSWIVLRYNIKINYTRKLGNLIKVPKYFIADFLPNYTSSALSMTMALAISQTLFAMMFYRKNRERFAACAYVFLSQDRREDRPDTLIFQITEDIMRFAIYFPFKLLVIDIVGSKAIIFIPIAVNNIGDGLAEPVGVAWGKHKYTTTALYHKRRFFHSKFTRSLEGSACVFITTFIVVAVNYNAVNTTQFWVTFAILPFLMTIAEAKAPHTNDGPFMALIGCGFLTVVFYFM